MQVPLMYRLPLSPPPRLHIRLWLFKFHSSQRDRDMAKKTLLACCDHGGLYTELQLIHTISYSYEYASSSEYLALLPNL